jgi:NDP-sugar pyrophosphorylase family protein
MKAGIIAAGRGERLAAAGISIPKPLTDIAGEPMIARAIRIAAGLNPDSIACIVNDLHPEVPHFLRSKPWPVPLEILVKTTPNSMESLFALAPLLSGDSFMLFTVDAICPFESIRDFYLRARRISKSRGVLALTHFVDDEKPLWARMDEDQKIIALGDGAGPTLYVTAGIYYFHPFIFSRIAAARKAKLGALRQFLGFLVENGDTLNGLVIPKTLDVDYPEDIQKAEIYLKEIAENDGP